MHTYIDIHKHIYIVFHITFHFSFLFIEYFEYSSPVLYKKLIVLYIVVCVCQSQTPNYPSHPLILCSP